MNKVYTHRPLQIFTSRDLSFSLAGDVTDEYMHRARIVTARGCVPLSRGRSNWAHYKLFAILVTASAASSSKISVTRLILSTTSSFNCEGPSSGSEEIGLRQLRNETGIS